MHTYIHTYIYTYIHTHIHTYIQHTFDLQMYIRTCVYVHIHLYSVPHRTRLQIEPISGMNLKSWSLDYYIPHTTPYGDGLGCYFILYTRGTGNGLTKFWIEVEVSCYGNVHLVHVSSANIQVKLTVRCSPCIYCGYHGD